MFDFKLDKTGDITFAEADNFVPIKISMFLPNDDNFPAQRISFFTNLQTSTPIEYKGSQKITFKHATLETFQIKNNVLIDKEEIAQNIMLQLRSELNGSFNNDVGSTFYKYKHYMIVSEEDLNEIASYAKNIIDDIIDGTTVLAEQVVDDRGGFFKSQVIKLTIYYEDEILTEYII